MNVKNVLTILVMPIILLACTDESSVNTYSEMEDWDSYEITGYRFFACSKDDFYSTGFKATKNGKNFKGTVCRGLFFRGSTLRLD